MTRSIVLLCLALAVGASAQPSTDINDAPEWLEPWLGTYLGDACLSKRPGRTVDGDRPLSGLWFTQVLDWPDSHGAMRPPSIEFQESCQQGVRRHQRTDNGPPTEAASGAGRLSLTHANGYLWIDAALRDEDSGGQQTVEGAIRLRLRDLTSTEESLTGRGVSPSGTITLLLKPAEHGFTVRLSMSSAVDSVNLAPTGAARATGPQPTPHVVSLFFDNLVVAESPDRASSLDATGSAAVSEWLGTYEGVGCLRMAQHGASAPDGTNTGRTWFRRALDDRLSLAADAPDVPADLEEQCRSGLAFRVVQAKDDDRSDAQRIDDTQRRLWSMGAATSLIDTVVMGRARVTIRERDGELVASGSLLDAGGRLYDLPQTQLSAGSLPLATDAPVLSGLSQDDIALRSYVLVADRPGLRGVFRLTEPAQPGQNTSGEASLAFRDLRRMDSMSMHP